MAGLSTHILDTANGCPAAQVAIRLFRCSSGDDRELLCDVQTNTDGRTDEQLLTASELVDGCYELEFDVGAYFEAQGNTGRFLDTVVVRVNLLAGEKYHVPLLVSPWSYSTYRGS